MAADRRPRRGPGAAVIAALVVAVSIGLAACAVPESPEVPGEDAGTADPVLVQGREVYQARSASCHGASGGGGAGPRLADGRAEAMAPDIAEQIALVTNGRGAMPGFGSRLDPDEIEAVVRYIREVL